MLREAARNAENAENHARTLACKSAESAETLKTMHARLHAHARTTSGAAVAAVGLPLRWKATVGNASAVKLVKQIYCNTTCKFSNALAKISFIGITIDIVSNGTNVRSN